MKKTIFAIGLLVSSLMPAFGQNNTPVAPGALPGVAPQAACYQNYPAAATQNVPILGPCTTSNLQTTVNCSTSGTAIFAETAQNPNNKRVMVTMAACLGTASYTYPTAFLVTPSIFASNNVAATIVSADTTTAMTVTGTTTTGTIYIEAY